MMDNEFDDEKKEIPASEDGSKVETPYIGEEIPDMSDAGLLGGIKHKFALGLILGIVAATLVVGVTSAALLRTMALKYATESASEEENKSSEFIDDEAKAKINTMIASLKAYYIDDVDLDTIKEGLYSGIMDSVGDKYTRYYTKEEMEAKAETESGEFGGIGATLTQDKNTKKVTVVKLTEDSPAQKAGLLEGDEIVSADDYVATEMDLDEFISHVRGEVGTTAHLVIKRDGETMEKDIERATLSVTVVDSTVIDEKIGYIAISTFNKKTAEQFNAEVEELTDKGVEGLIIDLRANGGGLVDAAVEVCDTILPEGTVVYTENKEGEKQVFESDDEHQLNLPIAVLVDENTASAAEIMAGAIRDYEWGTLIGTTTFGKGIVQWVFTLNDGSGIKITAEKYYTPKGDAIHGIGIKPDIEIDYELTDPGVDDITDNQVLKAIEVLEKEID